MDDESFIERHLWLIVGVVVALLGAIAIYAVLTVREATRREQAQAMLAQTEDTEKLLEVADQFPGTPAAAQSILLYGDAMYATGKYEESEKVFLRFVEEFGDHPHLASGLLGLGNALLAQGKHDMALARFVEVYEDHPESYRAPEARLMAGFAHEGKGSLAEAKRMFESVRNLVANQTIWRFEADRNLARLAGLGEVDAGPVSGPAAVPRGSGPVAPMPTPPPGSVPGAALPQPGAAPPVLELPAAQVAEPATQPAAPTDVERAETPATEPAATSEAAEPPMEPDASEGAEATPPLQIDVQPAPQQP